MLYASDVRVGGLYETVAPRDYINLFPVPHVPRNEKDHEVIGALFENEYFMVLEIKLLHRLYRCLKILTPQGMVGWTTMLDLDEWAGPVELRSLKEV